GSGSSSSTPVNYLLRLTLGGSGTANVTASPSGLSCGGTCSVPGSGVGSYAAGTVVTLTATPSNGTTFQSWSGACTGTSTTCTVTMSEAKGVSATFAASTSSSGS